MNASCPICRVTKGMHKMDCQNRWYVDQQLKPLEDKLAASDPLWDELCERVNSLTLRNNVLELENDKLRRFVNHVAYYSLDSMPENVRHSAQALLQELKNDS